MRLLLCSEIHCDFQAARNLVEQAREADAGVCAGDLAVMRTGLQDTVDVLAEVEAPTVLVAGNGESADELAEACKDWKNANVLHGSGCESNGVSFWGVGAAIPITPFGAWSYDIDEIEAAVLLEDCPEHAVLVTHSPPYGHVDQSGGEHLGSHSILQAIERAKPQLAVCGHMHACWMQESRIGHTRIIIAGPKGFWVAL